MTVDVLGGSVTGLHAVVLLQGIWVRAESVTDVIEYVSKMAAADVDILEQERTVLVFRQPNSK